MIEAVAPAGRVDAAIRAAAAGVSARESLERRRKRLHWLGALHDALGAAGPIADTLDDEDHDGDFLTGTRNPITAALDTVAELRAMRGRGGGLPAAGAPVADSSAVAALIFRDASAALATQARIGGRIARCLLNEAGGDAVNGA